MNKPTLHASRRYWVLLQSGFLISLFAGQFLACAVTPLSSTNGESDSVIGKPPPANTDPFAVITLPADATPVAHQGTLEVDEPISAPAVKDEKIAITDEKKAVPAEIQPTDPLPLPAEKPPETGQSACFSCVQICTADSTSADCSDAPQDMICGWGTAPELEQAKDVARAQCNATLDMARQMPMYSEIEGDCPPASCR